MHPAVYTGDGVTDYKGASDIGHRASGRGQATVTARWSKPYLGTSKIPCGLCLIGVMGVLRLGKRDISLFLRIDTSGECVIFDTLLNQVQIGCSLRDYCIMYVIRNINPSYRFD